MKKIIVGLTGASGSILFKKIVLELSRQNYLVYVIASRYGQEVFNYELEEDFNEFIHTLKNVQLLDEHDMFSQVASGSFKTEGLIIAPCSMGTIGKIAHGTSNNLLIRVADVCIKEQRKIVIVPREAPLSPIHLNNMLTLAQNRVILYPPFIPYYHRPQTLDEVCNHQTSRILSYFDIDTNNYQEWRKV